MSATDPPPVEGQASSRLQRLANSCRRMVASAVAAFPVGEQRREALQRLRVTPRRLVYLGLGSLVLTALLFLFSSSVYARLSPATLRALGLARHLLLILAAVLAGLSFLMQGKGVVGRRRAAALGVLNVMIGMVVILFLEPPPKVSARDVALLKAFNAGDEQVGVDTDIDALAKAVQLSGETDPLNLAQSALARNQLEEAVRLFDRALLDFRPTVRLIAETHVYRGLALARSKRVEEALAAANSALAIYPENVEALLLRCESLRKLALPQHSYASVDNPAQVGPLEQAELLEGAQEACEEALLLLPNYARARAALGTVYLMMAKAQKQNAKPLFEKALATLEVSLRGNPRDPSPWNNKAVALVALGRPAEALESAERALALKPDFADAMLVKGNALKRLNRLQEAEDLYRSMTEANPSDVQAWSNLGDALMDSGKLDQALGAFDSALNLWPDFADGLFNRGKVLNMLGRYEEALDPLERAIEVDEKDDEAFVELAKAYARLGRTTDARTALDKALDLVPDSQEAVQLRNQLQSIHQ